MMVEQMDVNGMRDSKVILRIKVIHEQYLNARDGLTNWRNLQILHDSTKLCNDLRTAQMLSVVSIISISFAVMGDTSYSRQSFLPGILAPGVKVRSSSQGPVQLPQSYLGVGCFQYCQHLDVGKSIKTYYKCTGCCNTRSFLDCLEESHSRDTIHS